jgi:hypothetical protein
VRTRGADDEAAGREGLLELPGLYEAGRWWLDRVGDEAGSSGEGLGRLDPVCGGHGEDNRVCRHHGREDLEWIPLDGAGAGGMAGAAGESRVSAAHGGHRMRRCAVSLEQAERGAGHDRLGQCEAGQGEEGQAAGAEGPGHGGDSNAGADGRIGGQS